MSKQPEQIELLPGLWFLSWRIWQLYDVESPWCPYRCWVRPVLTEGRTAKNLRNPFGISDGDKTPFLSPEEALAQAPLLQVEVGAMLSLSARVYPVDAWADGQYDDNKSYQIPSLPSTKNAIVELIPHFLRGCAKPSLFSEQACVLGCLDFPPNDVITEHLTLATDCLPEECSQAITTMLEDGRLYHGLVDGVTPAIFLGL